jgi:hypothetical protein
MVNEFGAVVVGAEQLPFGIVVVQEKLTLGVNPVVAVRFALPLPEPPVTVIEAGIVTEKSPPFPVNCTVSFMPLEVTVRVPEAGPVAEGVKVTFRVHVPLAGTLPLQLSLSAKPALAVAVKERAAALVFVNVTGWDALVLVTSWNANVSALGATVKFVPVPVSVMF